MMRKEFEQKTGYYPSADEYTVIEDFYMDYSVDKDVFCAAFKNNKDFLAVKIQSEVNRRHFKAVLESNRRLENLNKSIKELEDKLYKEQEWKPYEDTDNVSQSEYDQLKAESSTEELNSARAKDILYNWFGFAKEKIVIHRSIPKYEINRHRILKKVGEIERVPLYNATDWNYIRFDCGGMCWELKNDMLYQFLH